MHLQTLQALLSRLQHHKHDIIGIVDPDFEIAYTQIVKRIETLIRLYKDIKKLVETQEPAILLAILEHFVFFKPFLDAHGKQLAADLRVLQAHGFFEYAVKHSLPLADVVRSLDTDAIAEAREAFLAAEDETPVAKKPDQRTMHRPPRKSPIAGLLIRTSIRNLMKKSLQRPRRRISGSGNAK